MALRSSRIVKCCCIALCTLVHRQPSRHFGMLARFWTNLGFRFQITISIVQAESFSRVRES
jgi:hypothetical protein